MDRVEELLKQRGWTRYQLAQLLDNWDAMDNRDKELAKAYIQGITER
ncbi:MAG: hypothetical protein LUC94_06155 [Clostridiales bacterium]|nr:hypothetical protein [Clostridiales bacterium]